MLNFDGMLDIGGMLDLDPGPGFVTVGNKPVLVEAPGGPPQCTAAPPVTLPPPAPIDPAPLARVMSSFNKTVTIKKAKVIVAGGVVMQGAVPTWPGMMNPSVGNTGPVTINMIPINVIGDQAAIFPSGGVASFTLHGQ